MLWLYVVPGLISLLLGSSSWGQDESDELKEVQLAAHAFSRNGRLPNWVELANIPEPDKASAAAVVRLSNTSVRIGPGVEWIHQHAEQVSDSSDLGRIGNFVLQFNPAYQRLTLYRVEILRGDAVIDHIETAKIRFLQRETELEGGVYNGLISASFLLPDVRVGDTLHLVYGLEGTNPILGDRFSQEFSWEQLVPVKRRKLTLIAPAQRDMQWKWVGGTATSEFPVPVVILDGEEKKMIFEEVDIAPISLESHLPRYARPLRQLHFSEYESWEDVVSWADILFSLPRDLPEELDELVTRLRKLPNESSRTSAALQWVQGNIRYYSMALAESSHLPQQPHLVLQQRYGDCKDKSLLLLSMLRALDIEAYPALVSLSSQKPMTGRLPSPGAFDHAVIRVEIDGEVFFIDPARTGQAGKLELMGQHLEESEALVIKSGEPHPTTIHSPRRDQIFRQSLSENFFLDDFDQPGRLEVAWTFNGLSAESLRQRMPRLPPEMRRDQLLSGYERRYPGVSIEGDPVFLDDQENNQYSIEVNYNVPNLARSVEGGWMVLYQSALLQGTVGVPERLSRKLPVAQPVYPATLDYQVSIRWPEEVSVISNPRTIVIEGPSFTATIESANLGRQATRKIAFVATRPEVAVDELPKLIEGVRNLDLELGNRFTVRKDELKRTVADGRVESMLDRYLRQQEELILQASKTLESGVLADDDLADALCSRAFANLMLERIELALADVNTAVLKAPQSATAWECRGNFNFSRGEFNTSISDFGRALVLGLDPAWAYYRRALARYYAGQFDRAIKDLEAALAATTDESESVYSQMWLWWTLDQSGLPIPDELRTAAKLKKNGLWPGPALAMLAGLLTPEELLSRVNEKTGDQLDLALAEAWFYIGQWHKSNGDMETARAAFERAVSQNAIMYIEHTASTLELR